MNPINTIPELLKSVSRAFVRSLRIIRSILVGKEDQQEQDKDKEEDRST
jgi:hypothetical protein